MTTEQIRTCYEEGATGCWELTAVGVCGLRGRKECEVVSVICLLILDNTATTLKRTALVVYPVHAIPLNRIATKTELLLRNGYSLLVFRPVCYSDE